MKLADEYVLQKLARDVKVAYSVVEIFALLASVVW